MSTQAPPTYEIRKVADFFTVPEDRRDHCLRDFAVWLGVMDGLGHLFGDIDGVSAVTDVFRWIDDGKHDAHVNVGIRNTDA